MNSITPIEADSPAIAPYRVLATRVGVDFLPTVRPERLLLQDDECLMLLSRPDPVAAAYLERLHERSTFLVGPSRGGLRRLPWLRAQSALIRSRFRIIPHTELRKAMFARVASILTRHARFGLFDAHPQYSARTVATTPQAVMITAAFLLFALFAAMHPKAAVYALYALGTLAFFSCTLLRCLAVLQSPSAGEQPPPPQGEEPTYSVLVPLHHEAAIVPQLLSALGRIVWPRDRLEIKLICEADDADTIAAIEAHQLRDYVELIVTPPSLPRTKPKALRYALQACSGQFVVLYDAEDIPHPMQLHDAWRRFAAAGPELACVQAPLDITNGKTSWIAALFAFEYVGLFRCLLPWLAKHRAVLPLGGTSNHFRRAALDEVGAWDPHNVTEDADLGIRLARFGYHSGVISSPTLEEAPETAHVWRPQRARWTKGWMQTWLVHMRRPPQLLAELGLRSFLVTQVLLFGIVVSSLLHPLLYLLGAWFIWSLAIGVVLESWEIAIFGFNIFNIAGSYAAFVAMGRRGENRLRRSTPWRRLAMIPVYWLMMSAAAWVALFELFWRPFHWNKTPHKPLRSLRAAS